MVGCHRLGGCGYLICAGLKKQGRKQENEMASSVLRLSLGCRNGLTQSSVSGFPNDFSFIWVS